jgi:hypothetical protein
MTLADIVKRMNLKVFSGGAGLERPVRSGYASDLLSDVIANGQKDQLWITLQIHPNIVAVAALKELAAVILVNGREPTAETTVRADKEGVPILGTPLSAFEFAGKAYGLGIRAK